MHCVWKIAIPCSEPGPPLWPAPAAAACCWPGAGGACEVAMVTHVVMQMKNASARNSNECRFMDQLPEYFEIGQVLPVKSEIRNRKLDCPIARYDSKFRISDLTCRTCPIFKISTAT